MTRGTLDETALRDARDAITVALQRYPSLDAWGIRDGRDSASDDTLDDSLDQIATAIACLRQCRPIKTCNMGSYFLKHVAERWGEQHGLRSYVSNGAFIAAAVFLGYPTRRHGDGPNVIVAISRPSVLALQRASQTAVTR
jgi:hypothetical protein